MKNTSSRRLITKLLPLLLSISTTLLVLPAAQAAKPERPVGGPLHADLLYKWLRKAGADNSQVSVLVRSVSSGKRLLALNPAQTLNPASSIKLVTTYASLLQLGADYRWHSRFYLDGQISDGVLNGDLIFVGGGDPKFVIEDLLEVLNRMRRRGLQRIAGDLRIDNSLYAVDGDDGNAFDGQASEPYNVRPDAAMLNFKSTKFVVSPGRRNATLTLDPPLAGVQIHNRIRLRDGKCRYRANGLQISEVQDKRTTSARPGAQPVLEVSGKYSKRCGEGHSYHAVLDHIRFSGALFRAAWRQTGGQWEGVARREAGAQVQRGAPWLIWESPRTLADVVTDINKFSNNVMTRLLMLQLAAERGEPVVNVATARRQVEAMLRLNGMALSGLVLDNGAGLSRQARVSAEGLTELLIHAARGPYASVLRNSLPLAGVDGTMRYRLRKHAVAGHAWIKTGSLAGVKSMAGYLDAKSGQRYALAMLVNGAGARASLSAQDALLKWVYENG